MKARILLSFLMTITSCVTVPKKTAWIPFELKQDKIIVPIKVRNTEASAILDTGASLTVIDTQLARKAGIRASRTDYGSSLAKTKLVGYADNVPFTLYGADIRLNVMIQDLSGQNAPILFGSDLLRSVVVEFDFPGKQMRFHNLGGYEYKGPTKPIDLKQKRGHYFVEIKVNGEPKELLVDTGAYGAMSIPVSREELDSKLKAGAAKKTLKGANNETTDAYLDTAEPFQIGSYTINEAQVRYYDRKDGIDLEGILGMGLFKEFTVIFDTQHREMYLEAYE